MKAKMDLTNAIPTKDDVRIAMHCDEILEQYNAITNAKEQAKFKKLHWAELPFAIGYDYSPVGSKKDRAAAIKFYFLAKILEQKSLEAQLKRTVKESWKITEHAAKEFWEEVWLPKLADIAATVNEVMAQEAIRKAKAKAIKKESLSEDIEKHDTLNEKLFEGEKLKEDVREKIFEIAKFFTDGLAEDEIKINVKDIILVGSNASYNYTKDSDLDIHLIADLSATSCPDNLYPKLYSAYRSIFNKNMDIDFYGIPVELYVETGEVPLVSNGIYSVMKDEWVKKPVQQDIPEIDHEAFDKEFKVWEDRYNELIKDINS